MTSRRVSCATLKATGPRAANARGLPAALGAKQKKGLRDRDGGRARLEHATVHASYSLMFHS